MSDQEVPGPDAQEQEIPVVDPAVAGETRLEDPEVPEADGLEQSQPVPMDEDDAWR